MWLWWKAVFVHWARERQGKLSMRQRQVAMGAQYEVGRYVTTQGVVQPRRLYSICWLSVESFGMPIQVGSRGLALRAS